MAEPCSVRAGRATHDARGAATGADVVVPDEADLVVPDEMDETIGIVHSILRNECVKAVDARKPGVHSHPVRTMGYTI
jgi:hypothetical protein